MQTCKSANLLTLTLLCHTPRAHSGLKTSRDDVAYSFRRQEVVLCHAYLLLAPNSSDSFVLNRRRGLSSTRADSNLLLLLL